MRDLGNFVLARASRAPIYDSLTFMDSIISISNLSKTYPGGFTALNSVNLEIGRGEVFALLGPNGAGKTTLISTICGLSNMTSGSITVDGYDIVRDYRKTRNLIGLVPQELTTDAFETVWATLRFTRGLFGKPKNPEYLEEILKRLSLWDKRNNRLMTLSGGMKRRLLIAKALSHEPRILFLDEPSAGVDVELRKDMWDQVRSLRDSGVTIILTTHYIEEAEEMADRIGVISGGKIIVVEEKAQLMKKLGVKQVVFDFGSDGVGSIPKELESFDLQIQDGTLVYTYDPREKRGSVHGLLEKMHGLGLRYHDFRTRQSSLEDIFVDLVKEK